MISRAVFFGDPYRGNQAENIENIAKLFSPVLRHLGVHVQNHITEINKNLDHDAWIAGWLASLKFYPAPLTRSIDLRDAVVIGFEMPEAELEYLKKVNIPWVNFSIHPLRFLDDLYFDVATSFDFDMQSVAASYGLIDFCARRVAHNKSSSINHAAKKTLLICGQVWFDRSVFFDDHFKRLDDYICQLDLLVKEHGRVLYRPHPFGSDEEVANIILERYQAKICGDANIYEVFVKESVSTVCAISSSVLTEAPYFGIQTVFLEPRARRFGPAINYRALLDNSEFWEMGLLGRKKSQDSLKISQGVPSNYLRRTFSSWGFATDESRLEARISSLESHVSAVEALMQAQQRRIEELDGNAHHWRQHACALEAEQSALRQSWSWRVTAPLRDIGKRMVRLRELKANRQPVALGLSGSIHRLIVSLVNKGASYAQSSRYFRRVVLWGLGRMPGLAIKLRQMHMTSQLKHIPGIKGWGEKSEILHSMQVDMKNIPYMRDGVNSSQRTPLEKYFPTYKGGE